MKRIVSLLLAGMLIAGSLAGCGNAGGRPAEPVTDGFSARMTAAVGDWNAAGALTCTADGKLTLTLEKPASLYGVTVGWNGRALTMELGSMSVDVDPDKVPNGALIKSLLRVLTATPDTGTLTDEGYVQTGTADGAAYTATYDPETGLIRALSVPEQALTADFSDAERLPAQTPEND